MLIYQGEEMEEDDETMADYDIQVKKDIFGISSNLFHFSNANTNAVIIIYTAIIDTIIIETIIKDTIIIDTIAIKHCHN